MDGRFLTAFVLPKKWNVIGYELKPFSLRHTLALMALESPVLNGDHIATKPEDIIIFLRICSTDNAFEALGKPTLKDRWKLAWMEISTVYFLQALAQIHQYMTQCNTTPTTYTKSEQSKQKENVPSVLGMATALMARLHMRPDEAWDCTVGQSVWYLTAFAVSEGADIKILSTEDEAKTKAEMETLVRIQKEALARAKKEAANR